MESAAENSGEILAGVEPIPECYFNHRQGRIFYKLIRGAIEAALVQIFDRAAVDQFATIFGKGGHPHPAVRGHLLQGPHLTDVRLVFGKIVEE